ncbi:uncharacterized protein RAG0_13107 [Rhynchosporium agropyri]|uniref:Uncharacterized protein n=1 Tax=Rhynchosporium agropyri TaxID=914238 RepID=A0A1E1LBE1_9HELO|nr:uncharacterized protein RAG0_13107 [Rhynchosporium agropyri]
MKFTTSTSLLTLFGGALAGNGIFAITGSSSSNNVNLRVDSGDIGEAPKCAGSAPIGSFPASGTIHCVDGYSLTFKYNSLHEGIAATYTNPTNTFTYNVPNNGCIGSNCQFGFTHNFPGKKARALKV